MRMSKNAVFKKISVNILIKVSLILCKNAIINTKIAQRNVFIKKNCNAFMIYIMLKTIIDITFKKVYK